MRDGGVGQQLREICTVTCMRDSSVLQRQTAGRRGGGLPSRFNCQHCRARPTPYYSNIGVTCAMHYHSIIANLLCRPMRMMAWNISLVGIPAARKSDHNRMGKRPQSREKAIKRIARRNPLRCLNTSRKEKRLLVRAHQGDQKG